MGMRAASAGWKGWRVGVVLLLGAVGAVLSAWVPACVHSWLGGGSIGEMVWCNTHLPGNAGRSTALLHRSGFASATWVHPSRVEINEWQSQQPSHGTHLSDREVTWPRYLSLPPEDNHTGVISEVWGWPSLSMQRTTRVAHRHETSNGSEQEVTTEQGTWSFHVNQKRITLPLLPIWRGFAANTAVFATVFGAVWFGPGVVRRGIRGRRDQCTACGYSHREYTGERCPECGASIEGRVAG